MSRLHYLLVCLILFACHSRENPSIEIDHIPFACINGQDVFQEELIFYMNICKADVISYFYERQHMSVDSAFWTTRYSDEIPIEVLRHTAWNMMKSDYMLKQWALEQQIIESTDFKSFLSALHEENMAREKAIRESRVVYGPTKFDLRSYYFFYKSTLQSKLKQRGITDLTAPLETKLDSTLYNQISLLTK